MGDMIIKKCKVCGETPVFHLGVSYHDETDLGEPTFAVFCEGLADNCHADITINSHEANEAIAIWNFMNR